MRIQDWKQPEGLRYLGKRKTEWGTACLCLISAVLLVMLCLYAASLLWKALWGLLAAAALAWGGYGLLAASHEWVYLSGDRLGVNRWRLIGNREWLEEISLSGLVDWKDYSSSASRRKGKTDGEMEFTLANGKKWTIPALQRQDEFCAALRSIGEEETDAANE